MKKILISAYSLDVGGIETALITLIKKIHLDFDVTISLEKKEGIFLKDLPDDVKIITYRPNNCKIKLVRKMINFIKQQLFKLKYKNKFEFSACYATYSSSASFIARNASKNNCLWVHNDYMSFYENDEKKYKNFFKEIKAEEFKKIVFVSEHDKNVFIKNFENLANRCVYCNNLIDYQKIEKMAEEDVQDFKKDDIITFINLGRHDEKQKRISRIVNATKRLNSDGFSFRVVLIGDGPDGEEYRKNCKDVKNIVFLGKKKNPYPYLKNADCLLMSSDFEGYPVVFIESLILEKPIITTDVSDSKNDIEGKFGIVVPKSEDGVYKGMKEYLQNGYKMEKFNPEEYNENIIKKLNEIIK